MFALDRDTAIDGVKGLYSFAIQGDGSLVQSGMLVDSMGSRPNELAAWDPGGPPPCPGDIAGNDQTVDEDDLALAVSLWATGGILADFNGDGRVDVRDLAALLDAFGVCGAG